MTTMADIRDECITEAAAFPPGSPDWTYRLRTAWKHQQWLDGIPSRDWTEQPPEGLESLTQEYAHAC